MPGGEVESFDGARPLGKLGAQNMRPLEKRPEETQEVANAFADIKEVPRWHYWMDQAIRLAAVLTILDFLYHLMPW
jgi:hypothetical protein